MIGNNRSVNLVGNVVVIVLSLHVNLFKKKVKSRFYKKIIKFNKLGMAGSARFAY